MLDLPCLPPSPLKNSLFLLFIHSPHSHPKHIHIIALCLCQVLFSPTSLSISPSSLQPTHTPMSWGLQTSNTLPINLVVVVVYLLSHVPMDYSPPASSVTGFSRQEYVSKLPFPPPGNLPHPRIEPALHLLHWQAYSLLLRHQGSSSHKATNCQNPKTLPISKFWKASLWIFN